MTTKEGGSWVARVLDPNRRARFASPHLGWIAALACSLLCAHSLGAGLMLDDLLHRLTLLDIAPELPGRPRHPLDLFRFLPGGAAFHRDAQLHGTLPWWTDDGLELAFFRPLASLTHLLDYRLWPEAPWWMHLHSLAWLAGLIVLVGRLYRRIGQAEAWVAGLGVLVFALFSGHGVAASWVANRCALMAAVFGVAALLAHDRGRREQRLAWKLAGPSCFAASLLCAEGGVAGLAYLGAYALILDTDRRHGVLALWPYLAVLAAWRLVHVSLGYGARGSALYVDPLRAPLDFLFAVLERLPLLVLKLFGGPPSHLTGLSPRIEQLLASVIAAILVALVLRVLWPSLRASAQLRFWALGALGCCLPACATMPHDRLLTLAAVGSSMLIALAVARAVEGLGGRRLERLAGLWLGLCLGLSPIVLVVDGLSLKLIAAPSIAARTSVPQSAAGRTLMVINTPEPLSMCAQLPFFLAAQGGPRPAKIRCMGASEAAVEIRRPNANTLLLSTEGGYLRGPNSGLLTDRDPSRFAGLRRDLDDLRIEVLRVTEDGRPQIVSFEFAQPLESPELVWVVWTGLGYARFELPPVGGVEHVPGHALDEVADALFE